MLRIGFENEVSLLACPSFMEVYNSHRPVLELGRVLLEDQILLTGNRNLHPHQFELRNADRNAIKELKKHSRGVLIYPGRSCSIAFSQNPEEVYPLLFNRQVRRGDSLYIAPTSELAQVGYVAVSTPLYWNPLHVRLVHSSHIEDPNRVNVPLEARRGLVDILQSHRAA